MRVLLPLRKAPPHNHASNSSLSDQSASSSESDSWLEDAEGDRKVHGTAEDNQDESKEEEDPSLFGKQGTDLNEPQPGNSLDSLVRAEQAVPSEVAVRLPETSISAGTGETSSSANSSEPGCHQHIQASRLLGLTVGEAETAASEPVVTPCPSKPACETRRGPSSPSTRDPFTVNIRKRRPLDTCDSKPPSRKKRPILDKKPPPQDLKNESSNNQKKMVGGRRASPSWRYDDDDRRDSAPTGEEDGCYNFSHNDSPHENNPASAHGEHRFDAENETIRNNDSELHFKVALKKRGLEIREQEGDGNCLFRAISLQVYGDPTMHGDVRKQCIDFMVSSMNVATSGVLLSSDTF